MEKRFSTNIPLTHAAQGVRKTIFSHRYEDASALTIMRKVRQHKQLGRIDLFLIWLPDRTRIPRVFVGMADARNFLFYKPIIALLPHKNIVNDSIISPYQHTYLQ